MQSAKTVRSRQPQTGGRTEHSSSGDLRRARPKPGDRYPAVTGSSPPPRDSGRRINTSPSRSQPRRISPRKSKYITHSRPRSRDSPSLRGTGGGGRERPATVRHYSRSLSPRPGDRRGKKGAGDASLSKGGAPASKRSKSPTEEIPAGMPGKTTEGPATGKGHVYIDRDNFKGPENPGLSKEDLQKLRVEMSRNLIPLIRVPTEVIDSVHILRRPGEGVRPMFERPDVMEGIMRRRREECETERAERGETGEDTGNGGTANRTLEQRVVAIIRDACPQFQDISLGIYETIQRCVLSPDGQSPRFSPPHHCDARHEDLRFDLDRRREAGRRSSRSPPRPPDREREREREYYSRRRGSPPHRDYPDRERDHRDREYRHRDERYYHDRHRSPRDPREGRSYHRSPSPGYRHRRHDSRERYSSSRHRSRSHEAHRHHREAPPLTSQVVRIQAPDDQMGGVPPHLIPQLDPQSVPRGRGYFEHDNRDTFVPFHRGGMRGGFNPGGFAPRGDFPPRGGFVPRGRGRGGFGGGGGGGGFPPFQRPPFFNPQTGPPPRSRARALSPKWKHDLFEAATDEPSSTTD